MSAMEMTKEQIDVICRLALMIPLEEAQAVQVEFGRIHAVMPIVDPTAYRRLLTTVDGHEAEVAAFVRFRTALGQIVQEHRDGHNQG